MKFLTAAPLALLALVLPGTVQAQPLAIPTEEACLANQALAATEFCQCLLLPYTNSDFCTCMGAPGAVEEGCSCVFLDGNDPAYCEACLTAVAGIDLAFDNVLDTLDDPAGLATLANLFASDAIFRVPYFGTYYGVTAISEYIALTHSSSGIFSSFSIVSGPYPNVLFKWEPNPTFATDKICKVVTAQNRRHGLNTQINDRSCMQGTEGSYLQFDISTGSPKIKEVTGFWPTNLLDEFFGGLKKPELAAVVCGIVQNKCSTPPFSTWQHNSYDQTGMAACIAQMASLASSEGGPGTTDLAWADGNSLGCRMIHATLAAAGNILHCPHVSILPQLDSNGDEKCQESYEDTAEAHFPDGAIEWVYYVSQTFHGYGATLWGDCPAGTGGADGDPHILDWGNSWYDYHGKCDLVLLDAPSFAQGIGLTAQIRTKIRYEYSFIEAAAIKIGDEVFEVGSYGDYFLSGVNGAKMPASISGFPITYEQKAENAHFFTVDMGSHGTVTLKAYKDIVGIKFEGTNKVDYEDSVGLMGSFETGVHLARDGKTIVKDTNKFGQEWQVQREEPLLFVSKPQGGKCVLPTAHTQTDRRLGETIGHEEAEAACADRHQDFEQCVYDVIAMGDLGVAQAGAF